MSAPALDGKVAALAFGAVLASLCAVSSRADAHRIGLSQGDYSVSGDRVDSHLTLAASELAGAIPVLDADGDTHLSATELTRQTEVLRSKIMDRMVVSRGGEACEGTLGSVAPSTEDGVILAIQHDCERGRGDISAELGFVNELEKGHRHVARVAGPTGKSEVVLYEGNTQLVLGSGGAPGASRPEFEYLKLGFEHILGGADHLLFLVGVVLFPASLRSLLLAVTAFTLSHSLTLVLSTLGLVRVSPSWVEPLIALSVAYIGVENWFLKDASRRWRLTFAFGLVHGLGFAGALRDIGIPSSRLPVALACFNVGVELGQLLVVLLLWTVVRRLHERSWFRPWVLGTASIALALVGSVWSVERAGLFLEPVAAALGNASAAWARENHVAGRERPANSGSTPAPPLVTRLCQSLSELPRVRRAECGHSKPGISLTNQCARMLAMSVLSGAVSLVEAEADRCIAELRARYEGCGFVEQASLPPLATCGRVLSGNLGVEATCRSSLECAGGLHCEGVGPMDSGRCRAPRDDGGSCGLSVDPLLSYVQGAAGGDRAECKGVCVNNRCRGRDPRIAHRPSE